MFCEKCGGGKPEHPIRPEDFPGTGEHAAPGIVRGQDGVLRWKYDMSMWKNPTFIITLGKVTLLSIGIFVVILFIVDMSRGESLMEALRRGGFLIVLAGGIMFVLMLVSYVILALIYGGRYTVLFEMDEKGVTHTQAKAQSGKLRGIFIVFSVLLSLTGRRGIMRGASQYHAVSGAGKHSGFDSVKKAVVNPGRNVIYLSHTLHQNQVYARPEDFAFVRDFILEHLKNAKVVQK